MRSRSFFFAPLLTALALVSAHLADAQQSFVLQQSLFPLPAGAQSNVRQGTSVAIDGDVAVVGAPQANVGASSSGAVKVYNTRTGALLHTLLNPTPNRTNNANFGAAVAISGTRVVVGELFENTGGDSVGIAYAYDLAGPNPTVPVATLPNPSPRHDDYFGRAVAISGTRVVVGSDLNDSGITAGGAHVFDLASSTPSVPVFSLNNPTPLDLEYFGSAVAISGDWVIIGAYGERTVTFFVGAAYVYNLAGANPTVPTYTLPNPTPTEGDYFGVSVGISGRTAVVGARFDSTAAPNSGSAYVYDLLGATPAVPRFTLTRPNALGLESFGVSVAISEHRVVVSAHRDNTGATNAGAAFVFDLTSPNPSVPLVMLTNPTPEAQDVFGRQVSISGSRVIVGTPMDDTVAFDAGSAYLYDVTNATPGVPIATLNSPTPTGGDLFGSAVAIAGSQIVVGAYWDDTGASNAGRAYVFDLSTAAPATASLVITNPAPSRDDGFGYAVAIGGRRVVIGAIRNDTGATDAGTVYVYDIGDATPARPFLTLTNPTPGSGDLFGYSVAISGARIAIGAPFDDTIAANSGSVYVYDLNSPMPAVPSVTLKKPNPATADLFGSSVAISETRVVVGAPSADTPASNTGQSYLFELTNAVPTNPVAIYTNPSPEFDDRFGTSVAISGSLVAIGAPRDNTGALRAGSVYVYDFAGAEPTTPVHTFTNPVPVADSSFGFSVSLSQTRVVVGATNAGAAYVYDLNSATPRVPVATLTNPSPQPGSTLGWAVAIDGTTVVAGAPFDVTLNSGAAYAFGFRRPSLRFVAASGQAILSWTPTNEPGLLLQYTDSLAAADWMNALSGSTNPVNIPFSNTSRFYRVWRP